MLSGWCGQRGKPNCKACRSDLCSHECHEGVNTQVNGADRTSERVRSDMKRGPDRVNGADPLATNLPTQKGA